MNINEYIKEKLEKCVRLNTEDEGTLIGLPYPYSVPCAEGAFQEMFYWDTYFTNKGYLASGDVKQAKNNAQNMFYLINRYGFVPNGSRTSFLNRSQPPFLSLMVLDIYKQTKDKDWLKSAYSALCAEYRFWMNERITESGLNRYDSAPLDPEADYSGSVNYLCSRIGFKPQETDFEVARGARAGYESGWDMTPRMTYKTHRFLPVDLNSLIYALEKNLEFFAEELDIPEDAANFRTAALKRAALCRKYMLCDGIFYDYNFVEKQHSKLVSVANFYPLFCGLATEQEAANAVKLLDKLETEYGILTCEENDVEGTYQWDFPNGWAPMQLIVAAGLMNYGYTEDALRIARKFKDTVERGFEATGHLWEKYNILDGSTEAKNEYQMPAMMGWTFGVYTYFCKLLEQI